MADKPTKATSPSASVALSAADAFLRYSKQFTDALPEDLNQAANVAVRNIGALIGSATTLAFATELYLKSLLIFFTTDIPQDHNLWTIFKKLPPELRQGIEKEFNERSTSLPKKQIDALELNILPLNRSAKTIPHPPPELKHELSSILKRSRNAFASWRYLYEKGEDRREVSLTYEHGALGLLCKIVRRMAQDAIHKGKIELQT